MYWLAVIRFYLKLLIFSFFHNLSLKFFCAARWRKCVGCFEYNFLVVMATWVRQPGGYQLNCILDVCCYVLEKSFVKFQNSQTD